MSLNQTKLDIPGLLRRFNLRPDKRLGQNYLVDPAALQRVVEVAEIAEDETVLEVGAGLGSLSRYLAHFAREVVAVELDPRLMPALKHVLSSYPNVHLVQGDILALDPAQLVSPFSQTGYLVVANIPYYITSSLLRHLLEAPLRPSRMVLTVQREVAERICAVPGKMSLLALSVQVYGKSRVKALIPASAFYPRPKVDSAVVRVDLYPSPLIPIPQMETFFRLAKAGFSQKRKMLRNALAGGMRWTPAQAKVILQAAGINPQRRAETLSVEEWEALAESSQLQIE